MELAEALLPYDGDVFLYLGPISRDGYNTLSTLLENKTDKKDRVCLILSTYGGNPDAGYRMARALRHFYPNVDMLIPDLCKSAGTLVCIGANKIIIGDRGELGPLDIQLSKPDEIFENMSGLDIIQAINALKGQVLESFEEYLLNIHKDMGLKTKMAVDIASKLTDGLISPMAEKIDPITLGEHQRAMQIAFDYGERLNDMSHTLKEGALRRLIANYPSHAFVIDRKEACTLFENVSKPEADTIKLYEWSRNIVRIMNNTPVVVDLEVEAATTTDRRNTNVTTNANTAENENDPAPEPEDTQREQQHDEEPVQEGEPNEQITEPEGERQPV